MSVIITVLGAITMALVATLITLVRGRRPSEPPPFPDLPPSTVASEMWTTAREMRVAGDRLQRELALITLRGRLSHGIDRRETR